MAIIRVSVKLPHQSNPNGSKEDFFFFIFVPPIGSDVCSLKQRQQTHRQSVVDWNSVARQSPKAVQMTQNELFKIVVLGLLISLEHDLI
jgi:hypothetical protein